MDDDWYLQWRGLEAACAMANLLICGAIAWICLCRISLMTGPSTRRATRGAYVICLTVALSVGTMPLWGREWPGTGELLLGSALLGILAGSRGAWASGPPPHARRDSAQE